MNERFIFPFSIVAAELGASCLFALLLPQSPLVRAGLIGYTEAHALPALGVWVLLTLLSVVVMPKLWRRRQNRSSKLALFVRIGVVGLVIDAGSSLFLWFRATEDGTYDVGSPVMPLVVRAGIYVALYALLVGVSDRLSVWHGRRNPPAATPPPRFGKA